MSSPFDCIIIGAGPSAEPVLNRLSKTKYKTLVIHASEKSVHKFDIRRQSWFTSFASFFSLSPKQYSPGLKRADKFAGFHCFNRYSISAHNFAYTFSLGLGGLSNQWSGGAVRWSKDEILLASGIPFSKVQAAYQSLENRFNLQPIDKTSDCALDYPFSEFDTKSIHFQRPLFFLSDLKRSETKIKPDYDQQYVWSAKSYFKLLESKCLHISFSEAFVVSMYRDNGIWHLRCILGGVSQIYKAKSIFLCAGAVSTAALLYTVDLENMRVGEICQVPLWHNSTSIVPVFGPCSSQTDNSPQLPEYHWDLLSDSTLPLASGYFFTSQVIQKSLMASKPFSLILSFLKPFVSHIYLLTVFSAVRSAQARIQFIVSKSHSLEINISSVNHSSLWQMIMFRLKQSFPSPFTLLPLLLRGQPGSDIHYACTVPFVSDEERDELHSSRITTDKFGRVAGLRNVFVCDPSRLSFLSSKPHTFTSMALTEASMDELMKDVESI